MCRPHICQFITWAGGVTLPRRWDFHTLRLGNNLLVNPAPSLTECFLQSVWSTRGGPFRKSFSPPSASSLPSPGSIFCIKNHPGPKFSPR
ncbi:hypothetical protein BO78DRAFT_60056 [Aspergillus sclerotiicarbonarius CBS 121057]|uniref:Uncharacterized protein n=1 Tax=Aspergillus sclerotiicarbonarius (strain CBS 121057 / IBT 28362) TaxID=1448318 RepID=A0A319EGL8_ASPSB|nr:hypothetical protein BO78DRAFT_60056 [Aspergillus sclerotiicarbonarius CBS 121057]